MKSPTNPTAPAIPVTLSEKELAAIPIIAEGFRQRYNSADTKIKTDRMIVKLKLRGHALTGVSIRRILGFLRRAEAMQPGFILSDAGGYWYSENKDEWAECWEREYGRAMEIIQNFHPLASMLGINPAQTLLYEGQNNNATPDQRIMSSWTVHSPRSKNER